MTDLDTESFWKKFRIDEFQIACIHGWVLSVRPGQLTLGSLVLSAQSGAQSFEALETERGLLEGLSISEKMARDVYGAVRINVLCLMMQDPIVHFHILPRFDKTIKRYGKVWVDEAWPAPPNMSPILTEDEIIRSIHHDLSRYFLEL